MQADTTEHSSDGSWCFECTTLAPATHRPMRGDKGAPHFMSARISPLACTFTANALHDDSRCCHPQHAYS